MPIATKPTKHSNGLNTDNTPQSDDVILALPLWEDNHSYIEDISASPKGVGLQYFYVPARLSSTFGSGLEWSGMGYSRAHANVLYAEMDGTSATATLYSASAVDGTFHARYTMRWGAHATGESGNISIPGDWEDMFMGAGYSLDGNDQSAEQLIWMWDGGKNAEDEGTKTIYGFPEPVSAPSGTWNGSTQTNIDTVQVITFEFPSENGSNWNMEAIAQDSNGDIYVIAKFRTGETDHDGTSGREDYIGEAHLWHITKAEIEAATVTDGIANLSLTIETHRVATGLFTDWLNTEGITAMDISQDGLRFIVNSSNNSGSSSGQAVKIFSRDDDTEGWATILADATRAGNGRHHDGYSETKPEAICFQDDSYDYYYAGEATNGLYKLNFQDPWGTPEAFGPVIELIGNPNAGTLTDWENGAGFIHLDAEITLTDFTIVMLIELDSLGKETLVGATNNDYIRVSEAATATRIKANNVTVTQTHDVTYGTSGYQLVVLRRSGSDFDTYIDGVKGSGTATQANDFDIQSFGMKAWNNEIGEADNYMDGRIGMIMVWDAALTDQEIADMWGEDGENVFLPFVDPNPPAEGGGGGAVMASRKALTLIVQDVDDLIDAINGDSL